jgi:hypothetical protein
MERHKDFVGQSTTLPGSWSARLEASQLAIGKVTHGDCKSLGMSQQRPAMQHMGSQYEGSTAMVFAKAVRHRRIRCVVV